MNELFNRIAALEARQSESEQSHREMIALLGAAAILAELSPDPFLRAAGAAVRALAEAHQRPVDVQDSGARQVS